MRSLFPWLVRLFPIAALAAAPAALAQGARPFPDKAVAPDGYTLLMTDNSTHAIVPFLFAKLPYDADRDLIPVSLTARAPLFLAVHPSKAVKSAT